MMNARALRCVVAGIVAAGCVVTFDAAAQKKKTVVTGTVQLEDDFSSVSPNWGTGKFDNGETWIEGGVMHVRAIDDDSSLYVEYDAVFGDHIIEVDTTLIDGTDDNWQTVNCRHVDDDNYYDLGISADGYYLLDVWVDGTKLSKSLGPSSSPHIRTGRNVVNALRIECVGTDLRLFVNGNLVAELTDENFSIGLIAFSVMTIGGPYSEVAFDNFRVTVP